MKQKYMNIISSSYGNDSIALIKWASEKKLQDVVVAYCDTGWAAPDWEDRVTKMEHWVKSLGFKTVRISSIGMPDLVRKKSGFPSNQIQFCTMHLKGIPFLEWTDTVDPECNATVLVGKRRAESRARKDTPEYIYKSEYHGERTLRHPLYKHSDKERDALLNRAGIKVLPHRSRECEPCVNANKSDFNRLELELIKRVSDLEVEIGKPMFRPKRFNAMGIYGVMTWAKYGKRKMRLDPNEIEVGSGCDGHYGCGL